MTSTARLVKALRSHAAVWESLERLSSLGLANWFLGAGCIAQTVWNLECGNEAGEGILDYDLVYFDPDRSELAERLVQRRASALLADLGVVVDAKNQARVHLWYGRKFDYDIRPYASIEDAIGTWPTTAGTVAVRPENGTLTVLAPFGLDDMFNLVVRANRVQITPEIYRKKTRRWLHRWPSLRVLPWEEGVGREGARVVPPIAAEQ